jgi:hypothetical protein
MHAQRADLPCVFAPVHAFAACVACAILLLLVTESDSQPIMRALPLPNKELPMFVCQGQEHGLLLTRLPMLACVWNLLTPLIALP